MSSGFESSLFESDEKLTAARDPLAGVSSCVIKSKHEITAVSHRGKCRTRGGVLVSTRYFIQVYVEPENSLDFLRHTHVPLDGFRSTEFNARMSQVIRKSEVEFVR